MLESTGSGGGIRLFCDGVGPQTPDIANSSRAIKQSELDLCARNGVSDVTEIRIGFDGIVIANSQEAQPSDFTLEQLQQALAAEIVVDGQLVPNPHMTWNDVDPSLPAKPIRVLGPPPTSGTRDAFVELVMEGGCTGVDMLEGLSPERKAGACATIRTDGPFIDAGENDNLIVRRLRADPEAYGIVGFSFLDQNRSSLQGARVNEVAPSFENIADASYPIARSMFFYVKDAHLGVTPGLADFVVEFTSERAVGPFGYLAMKGLIPLPDEERAKEHAKAERLLDAGL